MVRTAYRYRLEKSQYGKGVYICKNYYVFTIYKDNMKAIWLFLSFALIEVKYCPKYAVVAWNM